MDIAAGSMPDWLERRADTSPERIALMAPEGRWSFAQLHRDVAATARWLARQGVAPGAPVAVLTANGAPFVRLAHGIGRAGGVMVPLNTRLTPRELAWQLQDVGTSLLIYDARCEERAAALRAEVPGLACVPMETMDEDVQDEAAAAVDSSGEGGTLSSGGSEDGTASPGTGTVQGRPIDLSATHTIIYTSGTTGNPKGARLTYGNHWWSAVASALNLGLHPDDRWLACLPLFHVSGLSILMRSVIYGITAVVHDGFDPERVNAAIEEEGVTIVSVVATMLQRMLDAWGDRPYPPHLRCILVGGGPVPRPLLERCARWNIPVVQTYGLTETASQAVTLAPQDALRKLGSAGKPLLPNELRIIDGKTGNGLPPRKVGEITLRGPTVTPGYVNAPAATERAIRNGWLHTGDLGYVDEEGYLYVVDRRDDLIITGGENVYPAEVEGVLMAHPAVAEAGVAGLPDAHWGQKVAAAVVLRPGASVSADDLQAFCSQRLATYKIPRHIAFVDALPRNAAGKLLRRSLPSLLAPAEGEDAR